MWSKVNLIVIYLIFWFFLDQTWPGFHYIIVFVLLNICFLYLIYATFFFFFWWKKFSWDLATSLRFLSLCSNVCFFYVTRFSTYITRLCFDMHVYVCYFPNVFNQTSSLCSNQAYSGCSDWYAGIGMNKMCILCTVYWRNSKSSMQLRTQSWSFTAQISL